MKLQELSKLCCNCLAKKGLMSTLWQTLACELGFCDASGVADIQEFISFLNLPPSTLKRGRPLSDVHSRQLMYTFWVDNADVSNDRRNACHMVIKPSKLDVETF